MRPTNPYNQTQERFSYTLVPVSGADPGPSYIARLTREQHSQFQESLRLTVSIENVCLELHLKHRHKILGHIVTGASIATTICALIRLHPLSASFSLWVPDLHSIYLVLSFCLALGDTALPLCTAKQIRTN
jgi:hypothetical protein